MTYIPEHFRPEELVPPSIFRALNPDRVFTLFDDRLLRTADRLRKRYGPMIVNTWHNGGQLVDRGLRDPFTETGAKWSDHKFGRALDCHFPRIGVDQVRAEILGDPWHEDFKFITCLEMTIKGQPIGWLHFSVRNWDKKKHGIQQLHL